MIVNEKNYSTIWLSGKKIKIIDQTKLPFKFKIKELSSLNSFTNAIKTMEVRGAPLIGVTAAFGLAFEIFRNAENHNIEKASKKLLESRPTAVNLRWAIDKVKSVMKKPKKDRALKALEIAKKIREDDINFCERIGKNGLDIIKQIYKKKKSKINILTHCNAGWLATVDWGTALAPIFFAHRQGIPLHIWVDETRPRNQGALLTSWELKNEKVPHTVIVDNAGGHLMQNQEVDMCLVGSDRTTISGNVCNKIGTYLKALAAKENKIPFYVALPTSTIDPKIRKLSQIPIETRSGEELSKSKFNFFYRIVEGKIFQDGTPTFNPAFDVTPSKLITKLITEKGICEPNQKSINKLLQK